MEIDQYAHDHNIKWREDSSNSSVKYHRNRLRNEVIPILKEINPSIEETFSYTALRMASLEGLLNQSVSDFRNQIEEENEHLSIASDIISRTELVVIENVMREYGLNLSQVQSLKKSIQEGAVGKLFHTATHSVNIDRDKVYVSRKKRYEPFSILINEDQQSIHTDRGYLQLDLTEDLAISNSKNVVKLDFENISFPLTLRSWRQGDTFYPLGMRGKKKVSDFMIDEKIPLNLKSDVLVLTSGDCIMWIVGRRIDNRYKLTSSTTKALQLTFSND